VVSDDVLTTGLPVYCLLTTDPLITGLLTTSPLPQHSL